MGFLRKAASILLTAAAVSAAAACAAALAGCSSDSVSETEAEADETVDLTGQKCTIVRGDNCSRTTTEAAVALRKTLEAAGMTVSIETDWVKRGEEIKRFKNEIVIGRTNRPESEEIYSRMDGREPPYDYIVDIGEDRRAICAEDEFIAEAAGLFADEYMKWLAHGKDYEPEEMSREHVFPMPDMKLFGTDIGQWTIVYPGEYSDDDVADLQAIAGMIYTACGQHIGLVSTHENLAVSGRKILIGAASDKTPTGYDLAYIVEYDGSNLHIGGGNVWADWRAIYKHLLYEGFGTDYHLSQPKNADIRVENAEEGDDTKYRAFSISAWCTSGDAYETEEQVKQTAEAGFTKVNISGGGELRRDLMKWCAIYDLQILWSGLVSQTDVFDEASYVQTRQWLNAPHVWGFYLRDEPNSESFNTLAASTEEFAKYSDQVAFINLFPMYANQQQLGNDTYQEHIDQFMDTVKPKWTSVDIYPLNTVSLYDGYCENLDIMATACRERGIQFSVYLQSVSFASSKRTPSKADLEWQTWCIKSFGADEAIYFTYMTPYSSAEDFKDALIDHQLQPTDRYYYAQEINAKFAAADAAMAKYPKNAGAASVGAGSDAKFLKFDNQYDWSGYFSDLSTENKLLMGFFGNEDGGRAFTVVNCEDLREGGEASARFRTGSSVTVWRGGEPAVLEPDGEGYVEISLGRGEGAFCEING